MNEDQPKPIEMQPSGVADLEIIGVLASNKVSAWRRFVKRIERYISSGFARREPSYEEIENLLLLGSLGNTNDLNFNHNLAIAEVIEDCESLGWDITYNCLASSAGGFSPFDPPDGYYYKTREQALIALVAWFNEQSQITYTILMGNDSGDEIDVKCPSCELGFLVDSDGTSLLTDEDE